MFFSFFCILKIVFEQKFFNFLALVLDFLEQTFMQDYITSKDFK